MQKKTHTRYGGGCYGRDIVYFISIYNYDLSFALAHTFLRKGNDGISSKFLHRKGLDFKRYNPIKTAGWDSLHIYVFKTTNHLRFNGIYPMNIWLA